MSRPMVLEKLIYIWLALWQDAAKNGKLWWCWLVLLQTKKHAEFQICEDRTSSMTLSLLYPFPLSNLLWSRTSSSKIRSTMQQPYWWRYLKKSLTIWLPQGRAAQNTVYTLYALAYGLKPAYWFTWIASLFCRVFCWISFAFCLLLFFLVMTSERHIRQMHLSFISLETKSDHHVHITYSNNPHSLWIGLSSFTVTR